MLTSSRSYTKEFTFDKSSFIKYTIHQKLRNSNGNTFSFIPHVCYFSYLPWIAASEGRRLTTLFSTKMRGRKQPQEHQNPSPILLEFRHSSPPLCKNHKNPEVGKKIQACETLTLTEGFVFSSCRCSKQSVSRLLILNCSEHFIWCGCFQICSGNNNALFLMYACEVIHLINKGVTTPYVQEQ